MRQLDFWRNRNKQLRGWLSPLIAVQAATVNGDPLVDIGAMERVVFVMKSGEVVKNISVRL